MAVEGSRRNALGSGVGNHLRLKMRSEPVLLGFQTWPRSRKWRRKQGILRGRWVREHPKALHENPVDCWTSSLIKPIARANAVNSSLKRLQAHASAGGFGLVEGHPRVVAAEATLERLTGESERLSALYDSRSAVWTAASHTLSAVEAYLKNGIPSGVVLEDHESDVPKPVKGENGLLDQIVNCRRRSRELRADLSRLSSSPYPSAY